MDFIRERRSELVQRMGRQIINQVVDELYSKGVLNVEEKDLILGTQLSQEKARLILGYIENKGTAACKLFLDYLKCYDQYLFEDLKWTSKKASIEKYTEKDIEMIAEDLRNLYLSSAFQKFHPLGEEIDIIFDLETTFSDAVFWKKNINNRTIDQLMFQDLLDELRNLTVIEGEAGKGKTTLLKRIASLWASGKHPSLNRFKLVFFVSLRNMQKGLYESICEQLLREPYSLDSLTFMKIIEILERNVLFCLDGFDEFKSQDYPETARLFTKNAQYKHTVVLTTRSETLSQVRGYADLLVKIGDLTYNGAKMLIENVLEESLAKSLLTQLDQSSTMKEMMKTPLFVVIACAIQMGDDDFIPKTQTALFHTLHKLMINKSHYKTRDLPEEYIIESIRRCGDLALDGIFKSKFDFNIEDLSSQKEERLLLAAGLLNKYAAQRLKPVYRFFHKSFQEYTAGRRLHELVTSSSVTEISKGQMYLQKINTISDITFKYQNLLLYTCGSSKDAAAEVIKHIVGVKDYGTLLQFLDENEESVNVETQMQSSEEVEKLKLLNMNTLVERGLTFVYESRSQSALAAEFAIFLQGKELHINSHYIPDYLFYFVEHLPSCLRALGLIKLAFSGNSFSSNGNGIKKPESENQMQSVTQARIPEPAIKLFYETPWNQTFNTLQITLRDFPDLKPKEIKCIGKICCSALSLILHISKSAGITGKLHKILNTCARNVQDLVIESTLLTEEDEQQIVKMYQLKTLHINDLQTEQRDGGFIDGIHCLKSIEKLVLENVKMNDIDVKKIAESLKKFSNISVFHLSQLTGLGNGIEQLVKELSSGICSLQEIKLASCCVTGRAVITLAQNLHNLQGLKVLDLSGNNLGEEAIDAVSQLVDQLTVASSLKVLMLPFGQNVNSCLEKLLIQLKSLTNVTKLGLQKWRLNDLDLDSLASLAISGHLENLQCLDLAENSVTTKGWIAFFGALRKIETGGLFKLTSLDFSSQMELYPEAFMVKEFVQWIVKLHFIHEVVLINWMFDENDLNMIKNAKTTQKREFQIRLRETYK
ncbi:NLR family CARD domain-containing protein 4-like isoform X2 [Carcharodon carcharias]|uniref:NLR family CARD domain-containing protein 4-like isoform X1 n=2 Tax=Carcharodon carcharias TaxID=13397 RepID=UPI001B7E93E3|nr:NLR family CARD domain-containing protein 4-like isoform X1 [Carcharodon carcharias]XP_041038612.1 NLR family CARD domain-containing protein 4-like isoform X1 [Carcharodon carcharias]XP_041038613.1 NLR family CARD domain-containing protein 4-like isoform X1 [Carcharodon carcharias]XP_041038614.1 NLR family CARD domain-containing protein 4-like isoform X1 [Carcharodon carcharias]XP_041038615.1 NLR family CARD domain-containing protein 4-like isoform X1 [Carcharodon carcharias]XP_041038616.1 